MDQVDITGEALKLLQRITKALEGSSATVAGGAPARGGRVPVNRSNKDPIKATAAAMDDLGGSTDQLDKRFRRLDRTMSVTVGRFGILNKTLKAKAPGISTPAVNMQPVEKEVEKAAEDVNESTGSIISRFAKTAKESVLLGTAFTALGNILRGPFLDVITDAYRLQAGGVDAQKNLLDFYVAAGKAGMSLREYTRLLADNEAVVTRFGSFKDFNKALESTTDRLGSLGVFGESARQLTATMMSSATTLGIPLKQQAGVVDEQIKTFERLRKTTLMTADQFQDLVRTLGENENVQENLLGMAPQERAARLNELMQVQSLGAQLGLTKQQSQQLSDAMLAQRKALAPERFKAAGVIRQGGAIMGMSAGDTETLARLAQRKNLQGADAELFRQLSAQYQQGLEAMMNSGDIQQENIAEQLQQNAPGFFQRIAEASGKAQLTVDSGQAGANKDFGDKVGDFGKAVANFGVAVNGIMKSPLGEALRHLEPVLTSLGTFLFMSRRMFPKVGGAAAEVMGPPTPKRIAAKQAAGEAADLLTLPLKSMRAVATKTDILGPFKSMLGGFKSFTATARDLSKGGLSAVANVGKSAKDYVSWFKAIAADGGLTKTELVLQEAGAAFKAGFNGISGALKAGGNFFKSVFGPELGFIFGAVEEAFTGEMTKSLSLGDGIFGRMLGVVIAGFNGIFTGVTRLFDDVLNWLFEGLGIDFRVNTTKFVDYVTGMIVDGWKMISSIFMKGLAGLLEMLPFVKKDAPFIKKLRDNADAVDDSLMQSAKTREEMWNTEGATLRTMGEKQLKAADDTAKKMDAVAAKLNVANGAVVTGIGGLASSAQATINAAQTNAAQVATPGQETRATVTPPEVNKTQVEEKKEGVAGSAASGPVLVNAPDVVLVLKQQVDVLSQMLAKLTEGKTEEYARMTRPILPDTAALAPYAIGA